ncbi:hypothetical protein ES708_30072 [subsurface metagenome]
MKEVSSTPKWVTDYYKDFRLKERTKCFKTCLKCGETKLISKFSVDKRNLDGRISICKACRSLEGLNYYYHNRVKMLIKNIEYQKNNKRDRSIYFKNYREKHGEQLKENASKWYLENKEAIKRRNLKYYQEHKKACLARRKLWIEKNKEKIKRYNREYKRKHKISKGAIG